MPIGGAITPMTISNKRICAALFFFFSLMAPNSALSATYWVSATGAAPWANCQSSTPLSGVAACSLATANTNAAAGDTVYLRAGTYYAPSFQGGIQPSNNGSAGNMITFAAYTGETPIITQSGTTSFGVYFGYTGSASSYITVSGIEFHNLSYFGQIINGSNHIELQGNTFLDDVGWGTAGVGLKVTGAQNQQWVTNIWITGNTFAGANTNTNGCTDYGGGDLIDVGVSYGTYAGNTVDNDNYITIESNTFYHAAHAALDDYGMYQVIKNNVFHNEPWSPNCPTASQSWPNSNAVCTGVQNCVRLCA